jgi:hypothetical protein
MARFKKLEPNRLKNEYTKAMYKYFYKQKKLKLKNIILLNSLIIKSLLKKKVNQVFIQMEEKAF